MKNDNNSNAPDKLDRVKELMAFSLSNFFRKSLSKSKDFKN